MPIFNLYLITFAGIFCLWQQLGSNRNIMVVCLKIGYGIESACFLLLGFSSSGFIVVFLLSVGFGSMGFTISGK